MSIPLVILVGLVCYCAGAWHEALLRRAERKLQQDYIIMTQQQHEATLLAARDLLDRGDSAAARAALDRALFE